MRTDWRNGFLFVGNQLALDFVNTRPMINGAAMELLPDGAALARWLEAAGLIHSRESARLMRTWASPKVTAALQELQQFREEVRKIVFQMEAGGEVPTVFVKELNRLLLRYPAVDQVVKSDSGLERRRRFAPETPDDAYAPLVDAMTDLVSKAEHQRIRKCPSCVLHFYDTSKKGTRVWCSMNICGNRSKVAAFAARNRQS